MTTRTPVSFPARLLRKQPFLPRYVVVKPDHVGGRTAAFVADILLNQSGPFRRTIRPWGKGSPVFFFNLTAVQCAKAGLDTNDTCTVTLIALDDPAPQPQPGSPGAEADPRSP